MILGGGGGGEGVDAIGPIDSGTPSADGASISGQSLIMQSASATVPGLVNITTQSFAGQKTFTTGLTGTLTGSASLNVLTSALGNLTDAGTDGITVTGGTGAVVGAVSLSQHVADTTHNGYLSSTDWNTFNSKQATISIGTYSNTSAANGLDITSSVLTLHSADGTNPGAVSTTTQTLAGAKTFSTSVTSPTITSSAGLTTAAFVAGTNPTDIPIVVGSLGTYYPRYFVSDNVNSGAAGLAVLSYGTPTNSNVNFMGFSRGTKSSPVIVNTGDNLGAHAWLGYDGTQWGLAGVIDVTVDSTGTPGTGSMPGALEFSTTPTGSILPTLALRIRQNQAAQFASTVSCTQLTSTISTGTAPLVVSSTTVVANLRAATAATATNATNVATTATNSTNASFFPTFVASSSSGNQGIDTATGLTFNPSTNTLTTTTFSGALSGNASTVTTNANLTGPITSSGNATSIAAQTGTGTTFAMSAGPTFTGTVGAAAIAATGVISTTTATGSGITLKHAADDTTQIVVGNNTGTAEVDLTMRISAGGNAIIFSDTGKNLALGSNGSNARLTVLSSGNVGIGNTNDTAKLDVTGNVSLSGAFITTSYDTSSPTNGGTVTASANKPGVLITPAGTIAAATIKLPSSPIDGQIYWVASSQIITAVTWQDSGGTAGNVVGGPSTIGGTGRGATFVYGSGATKWYDIG